MTHNRKILDGLRRSYRDGRLHHAYILSGPAATAKVGCVESFAAGVFAGSGGGLFAASAPSEEQIIARIRNRAHPDFVRIEEAPDGEKGAPGVLDQIRDLPKQLAFSPLEAARRIVLIPDAAALTGQACNSVLKILEEPPAHTMFFLLCRDAGELLQTIVSRCQVLRFAPLSDEEMKSLLGDQDSAILGWSEGSPERAERLLGEEGAPGLRREACDRLLELWDASPRIPGGCVSWLESIEDGAPAGIVIDSWEVLFRDLAYVYDGATAEQIRFRECYDRLAALAARAGESARGEIPKRCSAINRFRVYRRLNGNLRLDFAALLAEVQIFSVGKAPTQA